MVGSITHLLRKDTMVSSVEYHSLISLLILWLLLLNITLISSLTFLFLACYLFNSLFGVITDLSI
jgi:hypothetical protein